MIDIYRVLKDISVIHYNILILNHGIDMLLKREVDKDNFYMDNQIFAEPIAIKGLIVWEDKFLDITTAGEIMQTYTPAITIIIGTSYIVPKTGDFVEISFHVAAGEDKLIYQYGVNSPQIKRWGDGQFITKFTATPTTSRSTGKLIRGANLLPITVCE
jgi:hypothetical protein